MNAIVIQKVAVGVIAVCLTVLGYKTLKGFKNDKPLFEDTEKSEFVRRPVKVEEINEEEKPEEKVEPKPVKKKKKKAEEAIEMDDGSGDVEAKDENSLLADDAKDEGKE